MTLDKPVLFFDGVCGLCNHFIDLLLRIDSRHQLLFAPLQGETARRLLQPATGVDPLGLKSVVLVDAAGVHQKTAAVARVFLQLGGWWRLLGSGLQLLPAALSNAAYDFVAAHRYALFGQKAACRLPTAAEKKQFLD